MQRQRVRARESAKKEDIAEGVLGEVAASAGPTEFLGYQGLEADARVEGVAGDGSLVDSAGEGQRVRVVLNRTPFYPEGGGQVGDRGLLRTPSGFVEILDTRPGPGGTIVHEGVVESGHLVSGEE